MMSSAEMLRMMILGALCSSVTAAPSAALLLTNLRCEYHVDPLGIDAAAPRLSWEVSSGLRGARQTAYQIQVAGTPAELATGQADLWDTRQVVSSETCQIAYRGAPLASQQQCWWRVRAWDERGEVSPWSPTAHWSMGLLRPTDWQAAWIGYDGPTGQTSTLSFEGCPWVWLPGSNARQDAPAGQAHFRSRLNVPEGAKLQMLLTCDDQFALYLNGIEVAKSDGKTDAWRRPVTVDLTSQAKPGENVLAVLASNTGGPAGLCGRVMVTPQDGQPVATAIDPTWRCSADAPAGWLSLDFDDSGWEQAEASAKVGDSPWGELRSTGQHYLPPSPYLRREFQVDQPVVRATAYVTALGLYELHLNGAKVGDEYFRPGWTDYRQRIPYQTYDVTEQLERGANAVGLILADGWYAGYVGLGGRDRYGSHPRGLLQLVLDLADGSRQVIVSDGDWQAGYGPIREADLLMGEVYDARLEQAGWDQAGFAADGWSKVVAERPETAPLGAYPGVPVRAIQELPAVSVTEPKPGVYVFDLGQNMVGWARLRTSAPAGTELTLRFAEMLNPDGTVYTTNLRGARCLDKYVCRSAGEEVWEPRFTFRGFRYVELTGLRAKPGLSTITGIVAHSDTPVTGRFACSNPMVNQLQHNIVWGQKGNFLEVPTDCPQRDERLGWMGDAQVFCGTAAFNLDVASFFTKWLVDVDDAQGENGAYPDVAPRVAAGEGTAAWADAGVIVPLVMAIRYDDRRLLARHYPGMRRFIAYCQQHSKDLLRPAKGYGDWLSIQADTPKDVIATAFFAYSASLTAEVAERLGKPQEAAEYRQLFEQVRQAFCRAYVDAEGRIKGHTQTCYVLALKMNLLPNELRAKAAEHLVADLESRGMRLSTGFVGTAYLLPTLTQVGRTDVAYQLLLSEKFPSWGFTIKHGATTIWERWDGWTPEHGFQNPGMNSFNHYAFGACGQWLYETVAGLAADPDQPGYRHFLIAPQPGGGLTSAEAELHTIRGPAAVRWELTGGEIHLDVTVPANTTATVRVPTSQPATLQESGEPASEAAGVLGLTSEDGATVVAIGSGSYHFRAAN